jgi:hypothetical protein
VRIAISKFLLPLAAISLLLGFCAAFAGTNDCDLGDIVLLLGLPGFLFTLTAGGLISGKI